MTKKSYEGGCLCGHVRYVTADRPTFAHLCSCHMCQKWSGAPTVAWVEFPTSGLEWTGVRGEPSYYFSSEKTKRGFCPRCGGTISAIDEGYEKTSLTIASLDDSSSIKLGKQHSFKDSAPAWWRSFFN